MLFLNLFFFHFNGNIFVRRRLQRQQLGHCPLVNCMYTNINITITNISNFYLVLGLVEYYPAGKLV